MGNGLAERLEENEALELRDWEEKRELSCELEFLDEDEEDQEEEELCWERD